MKSSRAVVVALSALLTSLTACHEIASFSATPNPFSPQSGTTFVVDIDNEAQGCPDWTLEIKNDAGVTVRTFGQETEENVEGVTQSWDGKNEQGVAVPEGTYRATFDNSCIHGGTNSGTNETISVLVDATPPEISNVTADPSAFNPTSANTTLSANLNDPAGPISWALAIFDSSQAEVRRYSGTGNQISQIWDGRDSQGVIVLDGEYDVDIIATDAVGNSGDTTFQVIVDTQPPAAANWVPSDVGNTIWRRPPLRVRLSDSASGVEPSSVHIFLDGNALETTYGGEVAAAEAPVPLQLDSNHVFRVEANDRAGNDLQQEITFRVIRVIQEAMEFSIPATPAIVPSPCVGCNMTFEALKVSEGAHVITLSSSAGAGSGDLRRLVSLEASIEWDMPNGPQTSLVSLGEFINTDNISVDDAFPGHVELTFQEQAEPIPDFTVQVPADVIPGSLATLRMDPVSVEAPCVDTSTVENPAVCGGPTQPENGQNPIPSAALESPLRDDPTGSFLPDTPAIPDPDGGTEYPAVPAPPDEPAPPVTPPLPSGTPIALYVPGVLSVKIKPGNNINTIVAAHGGSSHIERVLPTTSFTKGEQEAGMDRFFYVSVTPGTELVKLEEYNLDTRVEYVQLIPSDPLVDLYQVNDELRADQYHLFGQNGISISSAWDYSNFLWPGGAGPLHGRFGLQEIRQAVIDTGIRGTHEDFSGKVSSGWNVKTSSQILDGVNSEVGCGDAHGSGVAGMNTVTNNGRGLAGANFLAKLVPIVVWTNPGSYDNNSDCASIDPQKVPVAAYEASRRAHVVNQSSGYGQYNAAHCDQLAANWYDGRINVNAGAYTDEEGDLDPATVRYPGGCWASLSVTMTDRETGQVHELARPAVSHDWIAAPGDSLSTVYGRYDDGGYEGYYHAAITGTSLSAPIVSGVAQILMSHGVSNEDALGALVHSATPVAGCPSPCVGRLHAARAVKTALRNGTFEAWWDQPNGQPPRPRSGSIGWQEYDSCQDPDENSFTILKSEVDFPYHGGTYNVGLRCLDNRSGVAGEVKLFQRAAVNPGYTYRLDASVVRNSNGPSGSLVSVRIFYYNSANALVGWTREVQGDSNVGTTWSDWDLTVVAPERAVTAELVLRVREGGSGTGFVYWDDVGFYNYRVNT